MSTPKAVKRLNTIEKIEKFLTTQLPEPTLKTTGSSLESFENSRSFLHRLGDPQDTHPVIHVAGTSGKGTVSYMIDAILRAHDKRTALLVSPHVYDIRERIQLNGQFIPERHFITVVNEILEHLRELSPEQQLGYWRLMPVLGFAAAARNRLDYVVAEAALGGRYDTTNTVTRPDTFNVLTQIGIDHTEQLGATYAQIASEKAAIVLPKTPVVALSQKQAVNTAFERIFKERGAHVSWVERTENYLINDTLLALTTAKQLSERDGWEFDEEKARTAVNAVYIPGRFEKRTLKEKLIILDGAHNPQKIRALSWRLENEDYTPCTFVVALSSKKDAAEVIETLKPLAQRIICTEFFVGQPDIPVTATPDETLADIARSYGIGQVEAIQNPLDADRRAVSYDDSTAVVAGSFYLLGEIDTLF